MIEALKGTDSGFGVTAARERSQVNRDQFLKILVTELSNQDPMDPLDNAQFLQQLVGLQTLEQTSALTDALKTFERFLQMTSVSGLIGRDIAGTGTEGQSVQGKVDKVLVENGTVLLQVGPHRVPVQGIQEIL